MDRPKSPIASRSEWSASIEPLRNPVDVGVEQTQSNTPPLRTIPHHHRWEPTQHLRCYLLLEIRVRRGSVHQSDWQRQRLSGFLSPRDL